ncbi:MAG: sodium:solute symporter family protein [Planctomycetes bacterium]|jgi:Na+/proline symporter|nr:sodium:solute symporter family protein [Planctomycetota bacterium]
MSYLLAILTYLLVLTGIGIYKSRQVQTAADFSVAGRSLSPWILVCTMLAAWIGTGSIVGNAGKTYESGLAALILPIGSVLGMILLTRVAPRARSYDVYSVPEIIGSRYGQVARVLAVLALVIAYLVIVSYQFNALGAVLNAILTDRAGNPIISEATGTVIAAGFIITYTILAGLLSVAYTDVVTGIIITATLLISLPVLWGQAGGWAGMQGHFAALSKASHMKAWGVFTPAEIVNFTLPTFLLIMGDANQYQRFFASKSAKGAKSAVTFMIFAVLLIESLIILEAWIASSLIPDAAAGKYVLIYAAKDLLPLALGLFFMITIVGIIISTADSFLLIPATSLIRDIYLNYINPKAPEKRTVFLSRLLVLVLGIIAYLVSLSFAQSTTIFHRALYAYTIYGAAITPCLVAALFWKRATPAGAILSIAGGTVTALIWSELQSRKFLPSGLTDFDAVLPALAASVSLLVIGSLLTPRSESRLPSFVPR